MSPHNVVTTIAPAVKLPSMNDGCLRSRIEVCSTTYKYRLEYELTEPQIMLISTISSEIFAECKPTCSSSYVDDEFWIARAGVQVVVQQGGCVTLGYPI